MAVRGDPGAERAASPDGRPGGSVPAELGRFLVLWQVGAGGMGIVYVAYDPELDRKVAVKLLHPNISGSERESLAATRLLREAKALARLSHPNVVSVYDVGTYRGQVFIAMEFIEGSSLTQWLHERPRSRHEILGVFQEAGRGLAAAHREGLVHGDFKPDNVLVDLEGRVRVVDFGLASAAETEEGQLNPVQLQVPSDLDLRTSITRTSALTGTPAYLSPEQFAGARGSAKTDQFSFCVSLYEGLYGERPFLGEDIDAVRAAIERGVPPEPRSRQLPAWLRRVLLRGLSRDPDERFRDMEALLAALKRDPSRRRNVLALWAVVLVALVAAALVYRWVLVRGIEERQGLCTGAAKELVGVWDEERRAAAEAAFSATGLPYADDVWSRVEARLGRHAQAWVEMHTEACEATHLSGEQSPALLDLRMACLQRRLVETRLLVDVLVEADGGVVEKAVEAVAELEGLDACGDTGALLSAGERRVSPAEAALVERIHDRLAQARAGMLISRYDDGLELVEGALADAERLGDRRLMAEARLAQAEILENSGDPSAGGSLVDAFFLAESTDDAEFTARLSLALMHQATVGLELAEAKRWSRHARALIDRIDDSNAVDRRSLELELSAMLGNLRAQEDQLEEAEADYRRALEIFETLPHEDELRLAALHNNLGNVLVRRGEFDRAAEELERSAAIYQELYGPKHPSFAIALNNLGVHAMRRAAWEEARARFGEAHSVLLAALGRDHPNVGVTEVNLGDVALELREPAEASKRFARAGEIFETSFGAESPPLAYPLTGLGEAALAEGEIAAATAYLERALALRDEGDPAELARTRFALGRALVEDARGRAIELATAARDGFAAAGLAYARERGEVESWLEDHPPAVEAEASAPAIDPRP